MLARGISKAHNCQRQVDLWTKPVPFLNIARKPLTPHFHLHDPESVSISPPSIIIYVLHQMLFDSFPNREREREPSRPSGDTSQWRTANTARAEGSSRRHRSGSTITQRGLHLCYVTINPARGQAHADRSATLTRCKPRFPVRGFAKVDPRASAAPGISAKMITLGVNTGA